MLRVIVVDSLVAPYGRRETWEARGDMTGRELVRLYARPDWQGARVSVSHLGRVLEGADLDRDLGAGDVLLAPALGDDDKWWRLPWTWMMEPARWFWTEVRGWLADWVAPDLGGGPDRGDESSQTYGWRGLQTNVGAGFRVPIVYGEHDVGGTVISSGVDIAAQGVGNETTPDIEQLSTLLVLCEGPVYSIGGVTQDRDRMGADPLVQEYPQGLRINGVEQTLGGAVVSVRMGDVYQTAMPGFPRARTTFDVNGRLENLDDEAVGVVQQEEAYFVRVRLTFPQGLYRASGGQFFPEGVDFAIEWRPVGSTGAWSTMNVRAAPAIARRTEFSLWFSMAVQVQGAGSPGINVRVRRLTASGQARATGQDAIVDAAVFTEVEAVVWWQFAYPRRALLGYQLEANDTLSGRQPQVRARVRGLMVRVFDAAVGGLPSAARYWQLPEPGDPYAGIWAHPPGRNPAWIAADLLTRDIGLKAAQLVVDWPAFRDWADFCDQDSVAGGPLCAFDYSFDQGAEAWDALARVFRAGRAVPVLEGFRVRPVYNYRDAHGRGANFVPARARSLMVTAANLEEFKLYYQATARRPNVLDGRFADAANDYDVDTEPVEDPAADLDDPTLLFAPEIRRGSVDMLGVSSRAQVRRELKLRHAMTRLARRRVSFTAGPDQMIADVGDIVGVQHDAFCPHGADRVLFAARVLGRSDGTRNIVLDRDVVVSGGLRSIAVQVLAAPGDPPAPAEGYVLDMPNGTHPAGSQLATWSAQPVPSFEDGAVAVVCEYDGVAASSAGVVDFMIVKCRWTNDEKKAIDAVEWTPAAFDAVDDAPQQAPGEDFGGEPDPLTDPAIPDVADLRVEPGQRRGVVEVSWRMPERHTGQLARVFVEGANGLRTLVGETRTGRIDVEGLAAASAATLRIAVQDASGSWQPSALAAAQLVRVPEFARSSGYPIRDLLAIATGDGVVLRWQPLDVDDLEDVEVRSGPHWSGARVVARARAPEHEVVVRDLVPGVAQTLTLRARYRGGLYGPVARCDVDVPVEDFGASVAGGAVEDLATAAAGTASGATWSLADGLTCDGFRATYELVALVFDEPVAARFVVGVDRFEREAVTIGELAGLRLGDPEARWRLVGSREPSWQRRGSALRSVGDLAGTRVGDLAGGAVHGLDAGVGRNTDCVVEVSYRGADGATWGPFEPYVAQRRRATGLRVRLTLLRRSLRHQIHVRRIAANAVT